MVLSIATKNMLRKTEARIRTVVMVDGRSAAVVGAGALVGCDMLCGKGEEK
jgi:uncharacterized Zn-binding protein involved in type VI secretion